MVKKEELILRKIEKTSIFNYCLLIFLISILIISGAFFIKENSFGNGYEGGKYCLEWKSRHGYDYTREEIISLFNEEKCTYYYSGITTVKCKNNERETILNLLKNGTLEITNFNKTSRYDEYTKEPIFQFEEEYNLGCIKYLKVYN